MNVLKNMAGITALALVASVGPISAGEQWSLGTSSTGSEPYVSGTVMANVINSHQDVIEMNAQVTGGYNENLSLVAEGRMNAGQNTIVDLENAYFNRGKFQSLPEDTFKDLRVAFVFGGAYMHYLVRAESEIRSFEDIRGHKINLNAPSTFTRGFNENTLKAAGVGLDEIEVFSISTGKSFDALQDRVVDAAFHMYALNISSIQQLTATTPVRLLSLPDEAFEKLNKQFNGLLSHEEIPAGTYPGQTDPAKTILTMAVVFVNKNAKDEEVYALTKAYAENLEELGAKHSSYALSGVVKYPGKVPVHPGAARYLKERGIE